MNTKKNTILVVDDEVKIVEIVQSYLEREEYKVYTAFNGSEAISMYNSVNPALIILDIMLPDLNGTEVCEYLRKTTKVPIIMLTAKTSEEDIVEGLNIGADDYITKPFSPRQLIARVKALLRRVDEESSITNNEFTVKKGNLDIDLINYEIRKAGNLITLTPSEYSILITLLKNPTKIFSRNELISIALEDKYDSFDRAIDTHIKNLRHKIESDPKNPEYIITIRGIGYRFGIA